LNYGAGPAILPEARERTMPRTTHPRDA